jgi:hypothetical protein
LDSDILQIEIGSQRRKLSDEDHSLMTAIEVSRGEKIGSLSPNCEIVVKQRRNVEGRRDQTMRGNFEFHEMRGGSKQAFEESALSARLI